MAAPGNLVPALQSIGLGQYAQLFLDEGFDSFQQLCDVTEDDLVVMGIKLGHRRRLQRAIADARQDIHSLADGPTTVEGPGGDAQEDNPQDETTETGNHEGLSSAVGPVSTKRKYRRHPKPDEHAPERPPSGYVIFSNRVRERLKGQDLSFAEIAKRVGEQWQDSDPSERTACERQAQALKEKYYADLQEYKKTPQWAAYQDYLADFKAKHGARNLAESKKAKASAQAGRQAQNDRANSTISTNGEPSSAASSAKSSTRRSTSNLSVDLGRPDVTAKQPYPQPAHYMPSPAGLPPGLHHPAGQTVQANSNRTFDDERVARVYSIRTCDRSPLDDHSDHNRPFWQPTPGAPWQPSPRRQSHNAPFEPAAMQHRNPATTTHQYPTALAGHQHQMASPSADSDAMSITSHRSSDSPLGTRHRILPLPLPSAVPNASIPTDRFLNPRLPPDGTQSNASQSAPADYRDSLNLPPIMSNTGQGRSKSD